MQGIRNPGDGSPKFQLWWNDVAPILKRGGFAGLAAFATVGLVPLVGVTTEHFALFGLAATVVGGAIQALIQWATDNAKK